MNLVYNLIENKHDLNSLTIGYIYYYCDILKIVEALRNREAKGLEYIKHFRVILYRPSTITDHEPITEEKLKRFDAEYAQLTSFLFNTPIISVALNVYKEILDNAIDFISDTTTLNTLILTIPIECIEAFSVALSCNTTILNLDICITDYESQERLA